MLLMPESRNDTSLWLQTHCSAHSTGVRGASPAAARRALAAAQSAATASGGRRDSRPPRSGSMTITPSPLLAACSSPRVPAWNSSSM